MIMRMKQATKEDIPAIEEILLDAVHWLKKCGLENRWTESNIKWESLSMNYKMDDFYLLYQENLPVACMALKEGTDSYWPEDPDEKALFLHKLAVKRIYAGKRVSTEMIRYAKERARMLKLTSVRLDCNCQREKLRKLYESNGFVCVGEYNLGDYGLALYQCDLRIEGEDECDI